MTTINTYGQLTLLELIKRKDPNGDMAAIAEILNRDNPIVQDMPMMEANNTTLHKMTRRLTLPTGSWRRVNQGVSREASQTVEVTEGIGMLESYSEVDKALVDMAPNAAQFRMDEAAAFLEGMSQTAAGALIYGNAGTDPDQISGLAARMGALDASNNVIGQNGTGSDLTSIYIVQWAPTRVFGIYPKGSQSAGVLRTDLGEVTLSDDDGNPFQGFRDHFQWHFGLAVKDPRCIARLANIETSGATNTFDEDNLILLLNRMPESGSGAVIYVNATIKSQMEIKLKDKANVNFTTSDGLGGVPLLRFRGVPVKKVDAISDTETAIS